jgi:hypothetical protein
MRPCDRCLENNWSYQFDDATRVVTATCKFCDNEVSFAAKKRKGRSGAKLRKALMPFRIERRLKTPPVVRPDNVMPWD